MDERGNKQEIITFKADKSLLRAMRGISNRSEFIRNAVLNALNSVCPLCKGTGILTPKQREHWDAFAQEHPLEECNRCHEMHLVCENSRTQSPHGSTSKHDADEDGGA